MLNDSKGMNLMYSMYHSFLYVLVTYVLLNRQILCVRGILVTRSDGSAYMNETIIHKLIANTLNSTRHTQVLDVLKASAGVYKDKKKGYLMGLGKTVFIVYVSHEDKNNRHYRVYLHNFICFAVHYGIDLVVYLLPSPDTDKEIDYLESLGLHALTYPDHLFWR